VSVAVAEDLAATLHRVSAAVEARAAALDTLSTDVRIDLAELGRAGLFDLGFGERLDDMVHVIEEVSTRSLAVGFSAWAHRMTLHYLHLAPEQLREAELPQLRAGTRPGVTAMAAGLKHVAGLGPVPIGAEHDGADGLRVSGPIRWASNVFHDALIVLPASDNEGRSYVVAVDADADGVIVDPAPELMALGSTASTSLRLEDVKVTPDRIVSTDLHQFVSRIRPTFLLLQTAFCVGVGRAAITGAGKRTSGLGEQFRDDLAGLTARGDRLHSRLYELAADPARATTPDFIGLRLDAATLAVEATRLELALTGGAAYALCTAANRRFREAAFLPIQSPSEGQLRWELKQYE
jgi:alkylation response protein AidB-like acyl-CoA dehydrogenase